MLFSVHYGQLRFRYGQWVHVPKTPRSRLTMTRLKEGGESVTYFANKVGNIDVKAPLHIETMMGLGYPIYDGDGKTYPVPPDDLVWPRLEADSTYMRRCLEAITLGKGRRK